MILFHNLIIIDYQLHNKATLLTDSHRSILESDIDSKKWNAAVITMIMRQYVN